MVKNSQKTKVSIIILTTNALEMTKEQLLDIAKLETKGMDVKCFVVDNNSTDGTEKEIKNYKLPNMPFEFIQTGSNLGFAGGNNVGIKAALKEGSDYVVLLNNDLILTKDLVSKLVDFMKENPAVGAASPKMYFAKGFEFHKNRYSENQKGKVIWYAGGLIDWQNIYSSHRGVDKVDSGQYDKIEETDFANGACIIISRQALKRAGLLDDSLFLYWEDADFCQRLKLEGFKVMYFPKTHLWHKVSSSTGGSGSITNDYFLTRNRFYFALKYATLHTKLAVLKDTFALLMRGRKWQRIAAMDALLGRKGMGQWQKR